MQHIVAFALYDSPVLDMSFLPCKMPAARSLLAQHNSLSESDRLVLKRRSSRPFVLTNVN